MSTVNNFVILIGNVGKDPEIKYNDNGSVSANLVLATNDGYKDRSGNWVDKTTWHNLTCWGTLAKRVEKFIQKGTNITIHGRLAVDTWTDSAGQKKYKTYVQMSEFITNRGAKPVENNSDDELTQM
jgi:single-strand DNA-binding protein